ncbi:MAG: DEAD/DEAH box helicase [Candidatus Lokiarchaeota archaeon]|nr:DEAD/DEAH box helicase [Candidatus Lokiarchaeota archaeon]
MSNLRPYQKECVDNILNGVKNKINKQVIVMATGTGKTYVFGQLPPLIKQQGKKTLILAHREELLDQARDELKEIESSLKIEIEQAGRSVLDKNTDVVIASVQTIGRVNSTRIQKFNPNDFGLIIIDECHHSTAETYKNVLRYFEVLKEEDNNSNKILLGVTATPNRSDHTGLDMIFDEITFNYSLQKGIKEGYLSNIKAFTVETKSDISGVGTRMGEFIDAELSDAINTENRNKLIVETYKELTLDTKALAFASNVEHTVSLAEVFKSAGIRVGYILGSTNKEERKELLRKFKTGEKKVIINCNVLSEGFNEPSIETILMARPTKSSVNYSQQVGRGTRIFENKTHLNLIDFVDNLGNNNIITLPTLFGCQATLKGTKGKFITEIVEKIESIKEVNPDYNVGNIVDWNDNESIDKVIKEINIFEQASIPIEVKKYSTYSWLRKQDGFVLKLPPKDEQYYSLEIKQNMLDRYEFIQKEYFKVTPNRFNRYRSWKKVNETIEHTSSDLEDIFKKSDSFIKDNFQEYSIILNQKGSWRADAPSDKQLNMLKKFGIPVPANLSKGEASVLIGKYLQERSSR